MSENVSRTSNQSDIARRLRDRYECTAGFTRDIYWPDDRDLDLKAADEIERLTLENRELIVCIDAWKREELRMLQCQCVRPHEIALGDVRWCVNCERPMDEKDATRTLTAHDRALIAAAARPAAVAPAVPAKVFICAQIGDETDWMDARCLNCGQPLGKHQAARVSLCPTAETPEGPKP